VEAKPAEEEKRTEREASNKTPKPFKMGGMEITPVRQQF